MQIRFYSKKRKISEQDINDDTQMFTLEMLRNRGFTFWWLTAEKCAFVCLQHQNGKALKKQNKHIQAVPIAITRIIVDNFQCTGSPPVCVLPPTPIIPQQQYSSLGYRFNHLPQSWDTAEWICSVLSFYLYIQYGPVDVLAISNIFSCTWHVSDYYFKQKTPAQILHKWNGENNFIFPYET